MLSTSVLSSQVFDYSIKTRFALFVGSELVGLSALRCPCASSTDEPWFRDTWGLQDHPQLGFSHHKGHTPSWGAKRPLVHPGVGSH